MAKKVPGVGCGAAIRNDQGHLLLIQRLTQPEAGAWGLPGGKVDFGEPAAQSARREIAEELNVNIDILGLACMSEIIDQGDGAHWVSPVFEARIVKGEPMLQEPDKHGDWGWFPVTDLPNHITKPTRDYLCSLENVQP